MNALIICLWSMLLSANARRLNHDLEDLKKGLSITLPTECLTSELCTKKPVDYPSEDIDRVARQLQSRSKRHDKRATKNFEARNSCTSSQEMIQPFIAVYNDTRHLVIQSEFYKQSIPSVTCKKEGAGCLRDFKFSGNKPSCTTKFSTVNLCVLDSQKFTYTNINITFPVDCACELDEAD